MQTKMPLLPHRYYQMTMRLGNWQKKGRCFNLSVEILDPQESQILKLYRTDNILLTHKVTFYDFEHYRTLEGSIKEHSEDKIIISMGGGKEYEFSLLLSP